MKTYIDPYYPKTVFKYNPFTQYSKDAFVNHYFFISHPYHLNDLMDGQSYSIDMRNVSEDLYYEIKRQIIDYTPPIVNGALFNQLFPVIDKDRKILQLAISDSYFCFGGIISLAIERFNELMWSHYTNEVGYVVEFDTSFLLRCTINHPLNRSVLKNILLKPIHYKDHPISISCCKHPDIHKINLFNATQKNKEWSYENEWRFIITSYPFLGLPKIQPNMDNKHIDVSKRKLYYSPESIIRIYLGKKFWSAENIEQEISLGNNSFHYIVKEEIIPFITKLCKYEGRIYMSGTCDCAEFKFGTDTCIYDEQNNKYILNPEYYYLKRSFDLIKKISISGKLVYVEYQGNIKTRDEDFE